LDDCEKSRSDSYPSGFVNDPDSSIQIICKQPRGTSRFQIRFYGQILLEMLIGGEGVPHFDEIIAL